MAKKEFPPILQKNAAAIAHIYTGTWSKFSDKQCIEVIQYVQFLNGQASNFVQAKREDPAKGSWFDFQVGSLMEAIQPYIKQDFREREERIAPEAQWNDVQAVLKGAEQKPGKMTSKGAAIVEDFCNQVRQSNILKYMLNTLENSLNKLFDNLAQINSGMVSEATTVKVNQSHESAIVSMRDWMNIIDTSIVNCRSCVEIQQNPERWMKNAAQKYYLIIDPPVPTNQRNR